MICYLCGKEIGPGEKHKDHIVSDCFYVKEDKTSSKINLPTAYAHKSCGTKFSAIEDYVRDCLALQISPDDYPELCEKMQNRINSNLKYKKFIYSNIREIEIFLDDGSPLGKVGGFSANAEAIIMLVKKMVRGFTFLHGLKDCKKQHIPNHVPIHVMQIATDSFDEFYAKNKIPLQKGFIGKTWRYKAGYATDIGDEWQGYIEITLLNTMSFGCIIGMEEFDETEESDLSAQSSSIIHRKKIDERFIDGRWRGIYTNVDNSNEAIDTYDSLIEALKKIREDIFC